MFLKISQVLQKSTCAGVSFNKIISLEACNVIKETPTHVFFCEISEIFKNTYLEEHLRTTASENPSEGTYCFCGPANRNFIRKNLLRR